jgi:hypothetical protein
LVNHGGFTVVNVRDDGDVSNLLAHALSSFKPARPTKA